MSSTLEDLRLPAAAATKIDIGGMLLALVPPMSMRVCRQRKKRACSGETGEKTGRAFAVVNPQLSR